MHVMFQNHRGCREATLRRREMSAQSHTPSCVPCLPWQYIYCSSFLQAEMAPRSNRHPGGDGHQRTLQKSPAVPQGWGRANLVVWAGAGKALQGVSPQLQSSSGAGLGAPLCSCLSLVTHSPVAWVTPRLVALRKCSGTLLFGRVSGETHWGKTTPTKCLLLRAREHLGATERGWEKL